MSEPLKMQPEKLNRSELRALKQAEAAPWTAALSLPMFVAAIWVDWRWAATGGLTLLAALVLWGWTGIKFEAIKRSRAELAKEQR